MPGLLDRGAASQPPQGAAVAPQPAAADSAGEGSENVTPEEQALYDKVVSNGMNLMYSEQMRGQILQGLQGDGNPVEGLANTLVMLVMRLEDSAKQAGTEIPGDVMMHASTELLEQLVDLAEKANIAEFDDKQMQDALYTAIDMYRSMRQEQGDLPTEALAQDFGEIQAADQAGRVDEILPGLSELAKQAPAQPAGPPEKPQQRRQGLMG